VEDFLIDLGLPASTAAALKLDTLGRIMLAALLGGLVGLERELSGKPAGLRTNLLICMGATLLTELSLHLAGLGTEGGFRSDPARLAAQIIPGIGFIGAGSIIHGRGHVTGLTTAATLWVVTAIGIAVGSGAYVEAVGTTLLVLFTLLLLVRFERWISHRRTLRRYLATIETGEEAFRRLEAAMCTGRLEASLEGVEHVEDTVEVVVRVRGPADEHDDLLRRLARDAGVRRFRRI
jgi:putative Mg2+ transporter-C (MgtC) family protein